MGRVCVWVCVYGCVCVMSVCVYEVCVMSVCVYGVCVGCLQHQDCSEGRGPARSPPLAWWGQEGHLPQQRRGSPRRRPRPHLLSLFPPPRRPWCSEGTRPREVQFQEKPRHLEFHVPYVTK